MSSAIAREVAVKLNRRQFLQLTAGALAASAKSRIVSAQSIYPTRPIRLVVPVPPGGAYDAIGRPWAEKVKTLLGTVVVENLGGGGTSLGAAAVARAQPDGYTILLGGSIPHVNEALLKSRPLYDPIKDLQPILRMAVTTFAVAVHPSLPAQSLKELIDYAKANPGKLSYGHPGVGSLNHLTGELLKSLAGTPDIVQVPYKGAGPAIADVISGQIPITIAAVTGQVIEFHRTGKLRVIAVTSPYRLTATPEFPTAVEAGFPAMIAQTSVGLLAPAATPETIIEQIAQATRMALAERAYQQMLTASGFEPDVDSNPEKFRRILESDVVRWTPIVRALGLKLS
jgi:tripartite-type tricarboxylate transporter receptor subunit TctC